MWASISVDYILNQRHNFWLNVNRDFGAGMRPAVSLGLVQQWTVESVEEMSGRRSKGGLPLDSV